MIKQSEIGNFVSLIKRLKTQIKSQSPCVSYQKSKGLMASRKNSLMRAQHYKQIYFNKLDYFQSARKSNPVEEVLSSLEIDKNQEVPKKRRIHLCGEENKNRSFKIQANSLYKLGQLGCDENSRHRLIVPHKRSNTSKMNIDKQNKTYIQNSQNKERNKICREKTRTKWRALLLERKDKKKLNKDEMGRSKFNTTFQQRLPKSRMLVRGQAEKHKDGKDFWVLDAWQHPVDLAEEWFE